MSQNLAYVCIFIYKGESHSKNLILKLLDLLGFHDNHT